MTKFHGILPALLATAGVTASTQAEAQTTAQSSPRPPIQFVRTRPFIIAQMPTWGYLPVPQPSNVPPAPTPRPQRIQPRLPTDPGYPTVSEQSRNAQRTNAEWARFYQGMADYLSNLPPPTNQAEAQQQYSLYYAYAQSAVAIRSSNPQLNTALGNIVSGYYDWMTRTFGGPYATPVLRPDREAIAEWNRMWNERYRIQAAQQRQRTQDAAWQAMVNDRFGNSAWNAFSQNGPVTTLQLDSIYAGYDPNRTIPPASSLTSAGTSLSSITTSLSSAGTSLSSVGWSLSAAGIPFVSGVGDYHDPAVQSLYQALYGPTGGQGLYQMRGMDGSENAELVGAAYNSGFAAQQDPTGRLGAESGGYLAASLFDGDDYLRQITTNGFGGINQALAQPFNVILTWGQNAFDLDLHLTGPLGEATNSRFHIYFAATGNLTAQPFAQLIRDCICNAGSEVILTSALNRGGIYRVSAFNFGDQSATSTNLSNQSNAQIQIVRGGTTQAMGNGTTIIGGRTILTVNVPNGQPGNTWVAAELDPRNGRITVPGRVVQSPGSAGVQ